MKSKTLVLKLIVVAALSAMSAGATRAAEVKETWDKNCASCHGKDGKGETKMGRKADVKDYTSAKVQAEMTDDKAIKTIKEGLKDDKGKERMKAYGATFTDDEIKSLVGYVRAFKK